MEPHKFTILELLGERALEIYNLRLGSAAGICDWDLRLGEAMPAPCQSPGKADR